MTAHSKHQIDVIIRQCTEGENDVGNLVSIRIWSTFAEICKKIQEGDLLVIEKPAVSLRRKNPRRKDEIPFPDLSDFEVLIGAIEEQFNGEAEFRTKVNIFKPKKNSESIIPSQVESNLLRLRLSPESEHGLDDDEHGQSIFIYLWYPCLIIAITKPKKLWCPGIMVPL